MLKVIGENGKSVIVDAIQKFNNARVYVYDKEPVQTLDCYFISQKHFSVEEFCESVHRDIIGLGCESLPVGMVILYTNSPDINIVSGIWECARELEEKHYAVTTVVASR